MGELQLDKTRFDRENGKELERDTKMMRRQSLLDDEIHLDEIIFERSSSSAKLSQSENQPSTDKKALVGVQKSFFQSSRSSDGSDDGTEDCPRKQSNGGTNVVLFIKMALYPMSFDDYLWSDQQKSDGKPVFQHCYHQTVSANILLKILDGVEYIHRCKKVHRDLKPGNIMLSVSDDFAPDGSINISNCPDCCTKFGGKQHFITPHIGDFGLVAEIKESQTESSATLSPDKERFEPTALAVLSSQQPSRQPGTRFYCAPKSTTICPKMDVYSLGVIAFEMIYKFGTKSERAIVLDKLTTEGVFPRPFEKHEMADGIKAMLCRDVSKRWDCAAVRKWLNGLVEKSGA